MGNHDVDNEESEDAPQVCEWVKLNEPQQPIQPQDTGKLEEFEHLDDGVRLRVENVLREEIDGQARADIDEKHCLEIVLRDERRV